MTEVDLCDRLRDWAERHGFDVYPEVHGWDLVLVSSEPRVLGRNGLEVAAGEQVGIHAKLRANCEVLSQALPGDFASWGPKWPMVAVPQAGNAFCYIARRLGVGVIVGSPPPGAYSAAGYPRVHTFPKASKTEKQLALPPVASRAIVAGAPSPRVLSPWRVKALRFLNFARAADGRRFLKSDVKRFGISDSWVEAWGDPVDWTTEVRRGKPVRVRVYRLAEKPERLPDWGYADVAAELAAADGPAAPPHSQSPQMPPLPGVAE